MPLLCHGEALSELDRLIGQPFEQLPGHVRTRSFGVDYVHLNLDNVGDLYLTRFGWPFVRQLLPDQWFTDEHYSRQGQRLPGATGTVYRVTTRSPTLPRGGVVRAGPPSIDIVVKFSRVGQEVPLVVATRFPAGVDPTVIANARFNGPFEEFGLVMEMRQGGLAPRLGRVLAHRPLAIFAPAQRFDLWQLGRSEARFQLHQLQLARDQEGLERPLAIEMDIKRDYVLLYSWIKGEDAEEFFARGELDQREFEALAPRVDQELAQRGFHVLDNKPKHFILRRARRDGAPLRREGKLVYGLVDFELLERTPQYQQLFKASRRAHYWELHRPHPAPRQPDAAPTLHRVRIMGVDYIYGVVPNGGRLWTVGNDPGLFDYFVPDRWRRTPRLKLSSINEVYHTCTRDNIHVVYRRSRVGEKPHVEPLYAYGRQILEYGFNSPFEEVAIAQTLRRRGVRTVYPRAIYRTGHESEKAPYLRDPRRYNTHERYRLPDEPDHGILDDSHDYYVIWGRWRGIDPMHRGEPGVKPWTIPGVVDVQQALDENLLDEKAGQALLDSARRRMEVLGFAPQSVEPTFLLLTLGPDGQTPARDEHGELIVTFSIDALRAYEQRLLTQVQYRDLIARQDHRLRDAGFEPLELHGDHLLLSATPDGQVHRDRDGHPVVTHCNFDLVRPLKPWDR